MNLLGTKELIEGYTRENLLRFYESIVYPDAVVISIVGDVNTDDVIKRANELFVPASSKQLTNKKGEGIKPMPLEKKRAFIKKNEIFKEKQQSHIAIGFLGATITGRDRYPLQVISSIMSGQGGRLFIELRDKKALAYSVSAIQRDGIEPGFFAVYMGTSPDKISEAVNGILDEFRKIVEQGVTDEELKRAKAEIIGNYEIGLQEASDRASDMAFNELYGLGYDEHKRFAGKIESVTKEEVINTARRYFDMNAYTIVIVGQTHLPASWHKGE
ncbi:MAG: insulinase family protein [Deltaproteobacteria bacterium]|nr:insulinase family protein [Deltaproteobacteria bacterium]